MARSKKIQGIFFDIIYNKNKYHLESIHHQQLLINCPENCSGIVIYRTTSHPIQNQTIKLHELLEHQHIWSSQCIDSSLEYFCHISNT